MAVTLAKRPSITRLNSMKARLAELEPIVTSASSDSDTYAMALLRDEYNYLRVIVARLESARRIQG